MSSPLQILSFPRPIENGGNVENRISSQAPNNNNIEEYENYLLDLAIKKSQEQEDLEIEKDKEEELIQLALFNSIQEMNLKKEEKEKKEEKTMQLKEEKEEEKFDENFGICPIKLEYMKHPMLTPSGNYYEKTAIIDWINKNQTDPMTREKLTVDMLIEDKEYAKKIKEYKKKFQKIIIKMNK